MRQKFLDKLLAVERAKQNAGYPLLSDFINDWLTRTALFFYNEGERMRVQSRTCYEMGWTRI